MIELLLYLFCIAVALLTYYFHTKFSYWDKQKNIGQLKTKSIFGNYGEYILQRKSLLETVQSICKALPEEPLIGAYCFDKPILIAQDPEMLRLILSKDFYYFCSRELQNYTHREVVTKNLFYSHGDQWRVLRKNMTPLFSSAKMKNMFYLIEKCTRQFEKLLDDETKTGHVVEMRGQLARFTMDCICSCVFGIDSNVMEDKYGTNSFTKLGSAIFDVPALRGVKVMGRRTFPSIFYTLKMTMFPMKVYNFFHGVVTNVFEKRNFEPSNRQDFVDLVLSLKKNKQIVGDKIKNLIENSEEKATLDVSDELLIAQCIIFFSAGYETSASTLSFMLYEMAKKPEVQKKAQREVDKYLSTRNHLGYDCVTELPYLLQCMDEAMRLYPVLGVLTREVHEDYTFPNGIKVEKGTRVHLPIYHMHRNPKYFDDPDTFIPERFSPEARDKIKPFTYFPFGEGPRTCIGLRFAKMQVLAGLVTVLKKFDIALADGMPKKIQLDPRALVIQSKCGINLKLTPREGWENRVYKDERDGDKL